MIDNDFTPADMGFDDGDDDCFLRFSYRSSGAPRCRLVFDEALTDALRAKGCKAVSARVDRLGNILINTADGDRAMSSDNKAYISLDRYASDLLEIHGGDVAYGRLVMSGMQMIVLASRSAQPTLR